MMKHDFPDKISRRTLQKYYSRFFISLLLVEVVSQLLLIGLQVAIVYYAPYLLDAAQFPWTEVVLIGMNDIAGYLPPLLMFPLLLRSFPKASPIPRDPLSLWELEQAAVFCLGMWYFSTTFVSVLVLLFEQLTGWTLQNYAGAYFSTLPRWLEIVAGIVIGPFFEELIFRGILTKRLRGLGDGSAVLLSAFAFSAAHINIVQFVYAFPLGCIFGCIVLLTGSIRDTILLHMLINAVAVFLGASLSYNALLICSVALNVMMVAAFVLFFTSRKNYSLEGGVVPFKPRDKRNACMKSVWFWVTLSVLIVTNVFSALNV